MLVKHHIRYKEIHGVDEVVWIEQSAHKEIHNRLRREGECNIPAKELRKISNAARRREEDYKKQHAKYMGENRIVFNTALAPNTRLREIVEQNPNTGALSFSTHFAINHARLYYIDEV